MPPKIVSVQITGVDDFIKECQNTASEGKRTIGQLLLEAATMTYKFAIDSIRQGARSGRTYFKTKEKIPHIAAGPGEPPKTDTGRLVANILLLKESNGYSVGSRKGAPHGFWQEFGTSLMKAHPWLTPAFEKMISAISGKYK